MARAHLPSRHRARARALVAAAVVTALLTGGSADAGAEVPAAGRPRGHDVSSHQRNVNWRSAKAKGSRFVYVKATESHTYRNPYFDQQYNGATEVGIIRGAYDFALPNRSSGATQAAFFVRNGGGWEADGRTLPPALDLEYNPYGKRKCYGMSRARLVGWIRAFSDEVQRRTGRRPVIYTTALWWNTCTGGSRAFAARHALWVARYHAANPGRLPTGWSHWTFWQHGNRGSLPGDQNLFNGTPAQLKRFAKG
jgi:GH25 family lysozyme M1 (1,4-beta-N-acetylmuramidase)